MEVKLEIPEYSPKNGIQTIWEDNFEIKTSIQYDSVAIFGNKEGLISLARHLLTLAQENVPSGSHVDLVRIWTGNVARRTGRSLQPGSTSVHQGRRSPCRSVSRPVTDDLQGVAASNVYAAHRLPEAQCGNRRSG